MKSAVTICLVPELPGGPFVFRDGLAESCRKAAAAGYDAVEILFPSARAFDPGVLRAVLAEHDLKLAAVGTGAGYLLHGVHLCSPDAAKRRRAVAFAADLQEAAAGFGAPAVIGALQGRGEDGVDRARALAWLREGLDALAGRGRRLGVPLLLEPLNRYETNMINRIAQGIELIESLRSDNVKVLADLFHMNIEEADPCAALRRAGRRLGHVHFVDSNRRPAGCGHTDFAAVGRTLRAMGYAGYASVEALPYPDPEAAARSSMRAFRRWLAPRSGGHHWSRT